MPYFLSELECGGLNEFDKIFASVWFDSDYVVAGTKDNKLVVFNVSTYPFVFKTIDLPSSSSQPLALNCGIHCIAVNETKNFLATGAENPSEIAIFEIPSFRPVTILTGHKDWSFCCGFLNQNRVISGSRDRSVSLWSISEPSSAALRKPLLTKVKHQSKVRSLVVDNNCGNFCTLGVEGTIKTWDSETFEVINDKHISENQELVCLAQSEEKKIIAAGSQCHVSAFCQKSGKPIFVVPSHDGDWGVRSLSFQDFVMTIGGGAGRMAFYDLRKNNFLKIQKEGQEQDFFLTTGKGWLEKDETYYRHFENTPVPNTIYTHSYDPTGTRLFVGGGPLMLGLKGSYAGVW